MAYLYYPQSLKPEERLELGDSRSEVLLPCGNQDGNGYVPATCVTGLESASASRVMRDGGWLAESTAEGLQIGVETCVVAEDEA